MAKRSAHALIAIAMLLAASVLSTSTSAAHAAATAHKPKVGQCRAMKPKTVAEITDSSKPVPCSTRHTALTVAVPSVSTPLTGLTQSELTELGYQTCLPLFLRSLGRSATRRSTSAYQLTYFQPTQSQIQSGARWFRCDATIFAGKKLAPLQSRLHRPLLPKRADDKSELCLTGGHLPTPCSTRHAYRPFAAYTFKPGPHPATFAEEQDLAWHVCPARTAWWQFASPGRWAAGDRVLVCFAKTRK